MIDCRLCPLRQLPLFLPPVGDELEFIEKLKRREITLAAGDALIHEGQANSSLFTLLHGWAFRYKTMSDGRRQILNFLLAGDFIGVQQNMGEDSAHGVEILADSRLCVFERQALWELHCHQPKLSFNITWLTAREESLVDDNLLSVGRRSAAERVAALLIVLYKRAAALLPVSAGQEMPWLPFPLSQQHIADALGLSLAHTNKTLRKLQRLGLYEMDAGRLRLLDPRALATLADVYGDGRPSARPLV